MVTNPLTTDWVYVVKVRVVEPNVRVTTGDGTLVRQQINPVWNKEMTMLEYALEVRSERVTEFVQNMIMMCFL